MLVTNKNATICPVCNTLLEENAKFCPSCGKAVERASVPESQGCLSEAAQA
jgi:rubrerythrin